uniref:Uncharacterized protein n=1 Tax=viral metagenome TaxID=1070528 RepID=A0A6C0DYU5_9ZZZZ
MGKKYSGGFFDFLNGLLTKQVSAEGKFKIDNGASDTKGNGASDTNKEADIQIPKEGGKRKSRKHRKSHKKHQRKSRRRTY